MRPSNVRQRILKEHGELRERLDELERHAEALRREGAAALQEALARARAFYDQLRAHTELEDDILVPAMREADAWGDVRAEGLLEHHREQRTQLRELSGEAAGEIAPGDLAARLEQLIEEVRADMKHEESGILSTDLLRDDPIGINVEGG